MTKPKRYKRYSSEFKREAILRAGEEGSTDTAVCEELGISTRQFRRWRDELQLLGDDAFPVRGARVMKSCPLSSANWVRSRRNVIF